jgi:hypothetical protein
MLMSIFQPQEDKVKEEEAVVVSEEEEEEEEGKEDCKTSL